jgi:hypothetical protein
MQLMIPGEIYFRAGCQDGCFPEADHFEQKWSCLDHGGWRRRIRRFYVGFLNSKNKYNLKYNY